MRISTELIRRLDPSASVSGQDRVFDYVDVISYAAQPSLEPFDNVLWCVTSARSEDDESWYGTKFDRADSAQKTAARRPTWTVLTDSESVANEWPGRAIVVSNVHDCVERIHRHVLSTVAPVVVGVTGSVGKTTCVALIEDVLSAYGKTLRLYTKRIAPLNLFDMVINRLDEGCRFLTMEYSMYYRWHIRELTRLVRPDVGVMLNIETAHLAVDGIMSQDDILAAKMPLLTAARSAIVEGDVYRRFTEMMPEAIVYDWEDFVSMGGYQVQPFVRSRLMFKQIGAALSVKAAIEGQVTRRDVRAVEAFEPKEQRVVKIPIGGRRVFFDGEVTNASRIHALGDSLYPARALILHDVEFYNQVLGPQREQMTKGLSFFNRVFVSSELNERYRSFIRECSTKLNNVTVYTRTVPTVPEDHFVVLHWGAYWRSHSGLGAAKAVCKSALA